MSSAPTVARELAPVPASRASQPTYHYATVAGHRLFYREAGRSDAPALVLLHGFPTSSHMFRDLIPRLADEFHVIAPDYLGFGYSDAPAVSAFAYTFDALAGQVQALLDALGLTRYTLYLQDYGGPIGFRLASAHPERIAGLVVQNAIAHLEGVSELLGGVFLPYWKEQTEATEGAARALLTEAATRSQYLEGAQRPEAVSPDAWTHPTALLARPGADEVNLALFRDYASNVALYPEWQRYFREHQPRTLVVWGEHDPLFTKAGAEAYARDLNDCELHFLDGGHFALEEHGAVIAELIKEWADVPSAAASERVVRDFYQAMARGDVPAILALLADSLEWTEAEGFPYFGGTWRTPQAVLDGLLRPIARDWEGFAATPERLIGQGAEVVSLGSYTGRYLATGASIDVPFAHHWTVRRGRIAGFRQFTDTVKVREALGAGLAAA